MITFRENMFRLDTADTTYIFRITKFERLEHEEYKYSASALTAGIPLKNRFIGTGYNENFRMLGDFWFQYLYNTKNKCGGNEQ